MPPELTPAEQKRRVARGYDQVSEAYRDDDYEFAGSGYERILRLALPALEPADRVVELGCGNGIPVTRALAERCRVTGIDISAVQLARARRLVPAASFARADMGTLDFRPASLAAVVAFWSIIHVPLEDQRGLLGRVLDWLRPGGLFVCSVGYNYWVGQEDDWLEVPGATMYWSHVDRDTYREWFTAAGFATEREDFLPDSLGPTASGATVFFARKPAANSPPPAPRSGNRKQREGPGG
jgi:SAM-dependent methyltransferase